MTFPFDVIPPDWRCLVFRPLVGLTVIWFVLLLWQGRVLKIKESVPCGIMSLQLAGSGRRALAIVDAWQYAGCLEVAKLNVRLDWVFLFLYPVTLSMALGRIAENVTSVLWSLPAVVLAWGVLLAMPADALENVLLSRLLRRPEDDMVARRTRWLAQVKFLLFSAAFSWVAIGVVLILSSVGARVV